MYIKKLIPVILLLLFTISGLSACSKFLNVVPDKTGTIQNAFLQKQKAKQFLYSVYSYLPNFSNVNDNPALQGGDEFWVPPKDLGSRYMQLARGNQKIVDPYYDYWEGINGGKSLYQGIRKANIFMKRIHETGNISEVKRERWHAEAKFLKAYFYFYLIRMYGPVELFKHNLSFTAPASETKRPRAPVDSCFAYVIKLLNQVIHNPALPAVISDRQQNLGRITKSIAYSVKALVEITEASPLFNGNKAYVGFKNVDGKNPFDTKYKPALWDSAAVAAKRAIDFVTANGFHMLNHVVNEQTLSDTTARKLIIRNSFAGAEGQARFNVIWPMPDDGVTDLANHTMPYGFVINSNGISNYHAEQRYSPPLSIADMFYTNHGVPIKQDKSWNYSERFELQKAGSSSRFNIHLGYTTAKMNFNRGPRFYADLGFDGGIWYGAGFYDDTPPSNLRYLRYKAGQVNSTPQHEHSDYSATGYMIKKYQNYRDVMTGTSSISVKRYYWPYFRLAELYLLYAEAENEADGPGPQVYKYLNLVRKHAGLSSVQKAWSKWSTKPNEYKTKAGLRKIIHHETLIALAFEGKRFWDLRRWKEAGKVYNEPIAGLTVSASKAKNYYKKRIIYKRSFNLRDYFSQ